MIGKIKRIINNIPIEECIEYYLFFTENCKVADDFDYRVHLLAKLHDCCRHHKLNGKVMVINEFRAYNLLAWLEYMKDKYNI